MASSTPRIRVVHYGLGHIGREVVQLLLQKPGFELAGVIDNDPLKAGRLTMFTFRIDDAAVPDTRAVEIEPTAGG